MGTDESVGLVVRVAMPSDAIAMARLHFESHIESFAPFVPAEWVATRDLGAYADRWEKTLSSLDERNRAWVAEIDEEVVGIVQVYELDDGKAELASMHVRPNLKGRGIGSQLLNAAMTFMREAGYTKARLGVIAANSRARRFYERFGWRECHYQPVGVEGVPVHHYCLEIE